jgi:hypothetical protein
MAFASTSISDWYCERKRNFGKSSQELTRMKYQVAGWLFRFESSSLFGQDPWQRGGMAIFGR